MTYKALILRALAAGLVAGVVLALYTLAVVEPVLDKAVAAEAASASGAHDHEDTTGTHSHDGAGGDDEVMFSRTTQKGGGMVASLIYGLVIAFTFGSVFALVRHRLHLVSDVARAGWLAAVAFATIALVPGLKYPANPPGVGDPATVDRVSNVMADLELVARLEMIRLRRSETIKGAELDDEGAARQFSTNFREYGIDVEMGTVDEVATRLKTRPSLAIALVGSPGQTEGAREGLQPGLGNADGVQPGRGALPAQLHDLQLPHDGVSLDLLG